MCLLLLLLLLLMLLLLLLGACGRCSSHHDFLTRLPRRLGVCRRCSAHHRSRIPAFADLSRERNAAAGASQGSRCRPSDGRQAQGARELLRDPKGAPSASGRLGRGADALDGPDRPSAGRYALTGIGDEE